MVDVKRKQTMNSEEKHEIQAHGVSLHFDMRMRSGIDKNGALQTTIKTSQYFNQNSTTSSQKKQPYTIKTAKFYR